MKRVFGIILFLTTASMVSAELVADGVIIHLKADALTGLNDGDPVNSWSDSATSDPVDGSVTADSGYGVPVYKTGILNGLPVLRFVRSEQDVLLSSHWTLPDPGQGLTIFIVSTGGDSGHVERVVQVGDSGGTASRLVGVDVSVGRSGCRYNNGFALSPPGENPLTPGVFHIGIRRLAQGGAHDSLFYAVNSLEAETVEANNPTNTITFYASSNHISIGTGQSPTGEWYPDFFNGDLAEVLVYNRQLSLSQMNGVGDYLAAKYDLPFAVSGILLMESEGTTDVEEAGADDTIAIQLSTDPGGYPLTIQTSDDLNPNQVSIVPETLVFDGANWQTPQAITISALDDDFMERAVHETTVTFSVSTDPASPYEGAELADVRVNITDNDCGSMGFHPLDYNLDCRVNLCDFEIFALQWMECETLEPECQNYRP